MANNTERISTFIPEDVKKELNRVAKEKGLTMSAYVRTLIIEGVKEKNDKKK